MSLVEYFDPDSVYPLVEPRLKTHLPLRNLYWNSQTRSTRSIATLDLEFVPSTKSHNGISSSKASAENDGGVGLGKSRRHQLPGLRATPLLKVYFLRCDDKETYKAKRRADVRSWLDENPPTDASSAKQEGHDACEWLILHVVIPNTVAATQPRWVRTSGGEYEQPQEKSSGKSKWPGKRSRTILQKLRSDFNGASKSAPDRVAQVRLRKEEVPPDTLPTAIPDVSDYAETAKQSENAWQDLTTKFKLLILRSFDARVSQYEEDIAEKESQRLLPGWNFCTFFVLKEGLLRVFESVGLVKDALAGYDELRAGLDSSFDSHSFGTEQVESTTFLPSTDDLRYLLSLVGRISPMTEQDDVSILVRPLDPERKDYRNLIVSNRVSIFDFKCYITSRRYALLLQLATSPLFRKDRGIEDQEVNVENFYDPAALADACANAMDSIPSLTRLLRQDLYTGVSADSPSEAKSGVAIEVLVAAWTFAAIQQVLDETGSTNLAETHVASLKDTQSDYPRAERASNRRPGSNNKSRNKALSPTSRRAENIDHLLIADTPSLSNEALSKVAAVQAELCLMQRRILETVAKWCGWQIHRKTDLEETEEEVGAEVSRSNSSEDQSPQPGSMLANLHGSKLLASSSDPGKLRSQYVVLCYRAVWLFKLAGRRKSAEKLIADIASLKLTEGDYASAAVCLGYLASQLAHSKWSSAEAKIMGMHMRCLKMLNRKDDYVKAGLGLLAKSADSRKVHTMRENSHERQASAQSACTPVSWLDDASTDSEALIKELVNYSHQLPYEVTVPMKRYFADIGYDRHITLMDDRDGFQLAVRLRHVLGANDLLVDSIEAHLLQPEENQGKEIWLRAAQPLVLTSNQTSHWLHSHVSTFGSYVVERIVVRAGKIVFALEMLPKPEITSSIGLLTSTLPATVTQVKGPAISCFPRVGALNATITAARKFRLGKTKNLELRLCTGLNAVVSAHFVLKSGTAGLRLRTGEAKAARRDVLIRPSASPGVLEVSSIPKDSSTTIKIPYDTETNASNLRIRLEISYATGQGLFVYLLHAIVDVELVLDVNVEDVFKEHVLYSKFLLRSMCPGPLRVLDARMEGSDALEVRPLISSFPVSMVNTKTRAYVTYQIRHSALRPSSSSGQTAKPTLPLTIEYRSVQEDILDSALAALDASLAASPFANLRRLLQDHLESNLLQHLPSTNPEVAGSISEFAMPTYQALNWRSALSALPPSSKTALKVWLQNWHATHPIITLPNPDSAAYKTQYPPRILRLDFDVPRVDYLQTATLTPRIPASAFHNSTAIPTAASQLSPPTIPLGTPLPCTLEIRYTRRWAFAPPPSRSPSSSNTEQQQQQTFTYTISLNPTHWLLSGPRRGTFTASPETDLSFETTLVPLRVGVLELPGVSVGLASAADAHGAVSSLDDDVGGNDGGDEYETPLVSANLSVGYSPRTPSSARIRTPTLGSARTAVGFQGAEEQGEGFAMGTESCETDLLSVGHRVRVVEGWRGVSVGFGLGGGASDARGTRGMGMSADGAGREVEVLESLLWEMNEADG